MSWSTVLLGELIELENGYAFKSEEFTDAGHFLMRISNVQQGYISMQAPKFVSIPHHSNLIQFELSEGDMLMSLTGNVGRVGLIEAHHLPAALNQRVAKVIIKDFTKVDKGYLFSFFNNDDTRAKIENLANGAAQLNVSTKDIKSLPIPLPPLEQQKRIAKILDKASEIKAKGEQAIEKLDKIAQSTFIEMFGEPMLNNKKYKKYRVDKLCKLVRGSSPRPQGDPRYFGGNIPRLMVADLTRDGWSVTPRIDSLTEEGAKKSRPVKSGTVVMAVSGNPGLVSRLAVDACIHDGFVGFTDLNEDICRPIYLMALMHMSKSAHDKNKAGAIFVNLKTDDIKAMELPIPSIAEQVAYENFLLKMYKTKESFDKLSNLFTSFNSSLQNQAFTTGFNA